MSMQDQIFAVQELNDIYTEWMINPAYPEDAWGEFDRVMSLLGKFVKDAS
jgi:hypothetical protein